MFTPIETIGRIQNASPLRYRIRREKKITRLYIAMARELANKVKGEIKAWRLEIDPAAGRARLTGLIQNDGHKATREGTKKNGTTGTIQMSWAPAPSVLELFPDAASYTTLNVDAITSLGVEFVLPVKAGGKDRK